MLVKEFTLQPEALELKQLGFDEPCFRFYVDKKLALGIDPDNGDTNSKLGQYNPLYVSAPTYSQSFRWFREKYKLGAIVAQFGWGIENELGQIIYDISDGKTPSCYEESELDCLKKLIEIVKNGR
jgi:hypothetical protein